uniref:Uncharacterized protein n=1 Tax=Meloidogyne floridensis TaxID=298350 RepID=A0A915NPH3_9BILA
MRDRFGQLLTSTGRMVADFVDEQYPQQQQQQPSTSHGFGRTYGNDQLNRTGKNMPIQRLRGAAPLHVSIVEEMGTWRGSVIGILGGKMRVGVNYN